MGPYALATGHSGLLCAEVGHGLGQGRAGWGLPGSSWRGRDSGEGSKAFPLLSPWTQVRAPVCGACHPPRLGPQGPPPQEAHPSS